jgi:non-specific serine/threonine protein kinase
VRLFVERAHAALPSFVQTKRNASVVAEVCHRLDGIPLALELAAARVRAFSVEQIAQRLDDQLGLLTSGGRTAPPRQQTLRATLDWSYGLLSDHERLLFARLSIFAGGWTLEAAESVCGGDGIEGRQVLDLLAQLVDKSLVTAEVDADESVRYRLLETSRQYGLERLRERSAAEAAQRSHATYFLALAEQAALELRGASQVRWVERLEAEHDNLRAAQRWCVEHGEAEHGLRFGGALWRFWQLHGHLTEGRERLRQALGLAEAGMPSGPRMAARAAALIGAGALSWHQGEYALARSMYEESLAIFRGLGDRLGVAESLNNLGIVAWRQGEYALARSLYDEGLSIRRDMGDHLGVAASLHNLGNVAGHEGDYVQARSLHEQSLAIFRELGEGLGIVHSLHNLGAVAEHQGEYALARSLHKESLAIARELGNKETIARSVEGFARVAAAHGQAGRALRLAGAAAGLRDTINAALSPAEQELLEHGLQPAWQRLSAEAGAAAWALGQTMSVEQALAYDDVLAEEPNEESPDLAI